MESRLSRVVGGGAGVVLVIALGAAASVTPLVSPQHPVPRPAAVVVELGTPGMGDVRSAEARSRVRIFAWSN